MFVDDVSVLRFKHRLHLFLFVSHPEVSHCLSLYLILSSCRELLFAYVFLLAYLPTVRTLHCQVQKAVLSSFEYRFV